jgi:hypothetical protein
MISIIKWWSVRVGKIQNVNGEINAGEMLYRQVFESGIKCAKW